MLLIHVRLRHERRLNPVEVRHMPESEDNNVARLSAASGLGELAEHWVGDIPHLGRARRASD